MSVSKPVVASLAAGAALLLGAGALLSPVRATEIMPVFVDCDYEQTVNGTTYYAVWQCPNGCGCGGVTWTTDSQGKPVPLGQCQCS